MTTSSSDAQVFLEAIEVGIDAYVLKPLDPGKLFGALLRCWAVVDHRRQARQHEAEREALVRELQQALAHVKSLSKLLPICAGCRRIRDAAGGWQSLELYIGQHSETRFTHGLCEECVARLYPDLPKDP